MYEFFAAQFGWGLAGLGLVYFISKGLRRFWKADLGPCLVAAGILAALWWDTNPGLFAIHVFVALIDGLVMTLILYQQRLDEYEQRLNALGPPRN